MDDPQAHPGISIILPYWMRATALLESLLAYQRVYQESDLALEFVIVDDGSPIEPAYKVVSEFYKFPWPIRLVQLPVKQLPLNPCVAINKGVAAASAPLVFLTSPECIHRAQVLDKAKEMFDEYEHTKVVVMAVREEENDRWMSHSVYAPFHYHFANMMTKKFFEEVGGFDEDYRDGYCFDDPDFVEILEQHGVQWIDRDDLVVFHEHVPGKSKADPARKEKWMRNAKFFVEKWGHMPKGTY